MKAKAIRKITLLLSVILFGALLSITILNCGDSGDGMSSSMLSLITVTSETGQVMCGNTDDWCHDQSGGTLPLGEFALYPAYPNPANGTTIIRFRVPLASHVKIAIHNIYKGHVETLIDEPMPAAYYEIPWDASDYSSGLYRCYMWADDFVCSGRILIIQ